MVAGGFGGGVLEFYADAYTPTLKRRGAVIHDALAAMLAVDPDLGEYRHRPVRVELHGTLTRGTTVLTCSAVRPFTRVRSSGSPERSVRLIVETVTNVLDDGELRRILAVMAHPDDVDFGAAGTVAGWTDRGIEVVYLMVTDGNAGGFDDNVSREEMAVLRREEQRTAGKCVGVSDIRFLGYQDGAVEATLGLRRDIARVIRQVRPDRVLMPSPERNYERIHPSHPDHRAVGSAALDAVYPDARNPYAFPELLADEGLEAWTVREVWLSGGPTVNHYVDITDRFDRKLNALRAHVSQTGHMGDGLPEMLRGWLGVNAAAAGLPDGRLAESFQVIDTA